MRYAGHKSDFKEFKTQGVFILYFYERRTSTPFINLEQEGYLNENKFYSLIKIIFLIFKSQKLKKHQEKVQE